MVLVPQRGLAVKMQVGEFLVRFPPDREDGVRADFNRKAVVLDAVGPLKDLGVQLSKFQFRNADRYQSLKAALLKVLWPDKKK